MFNFHYLIKEIFAEKKRIWLTTAAIAWGTLSIVFMLAVGQGMLVTMLRYMNQFGRGLFVVKPGFTSKIYAGNKNNTLIYLSQKDIAQIQNLPVVENVAPEYSASADISYRNKIQKSQAISGIENDYRFFHHVSLMRGRWFNETDIHDARPVAVLGYQVVGMLFSKNTNPVGHYVKIGNQLFEVIGVTPPDNQIVQYETPDVFLTWIPATTFQKIFSVVGIQNILIKTKSGIDSTLVKTQILDALALLHHVDPQDKTFVSHFNNEEMIQNMENFFHGIQFFLGTVGTITLLVASIGIANIMSVAVQKATAEIGIRMACGARPMHIVFQYLLEAMMVTFLGGCFGFILAGVGILVANYFLRNASLFAIKGIHLALSFPLFFIILSVLGFIGVLAGIFPALRAARIQPVEALRHD